MNSPREKLLSMVYATRPLTHRASRRSAIGIREVVTYFLIFSLGAGAIGIFLRWYISSHYRKEMASWQTRQSSLVDDQAQRVADWLKERKGDAQVLSAAPAVRTVLSVHASGRGSAKSSTATPRESPANLDN